MLLLSSLRAGDLPDVVTLASGWNLQDSAKVTSTGEEISRLDFRPVDWYQATVPGTVLTTLVNNKVYPEPLYGENNRPDRIPESLARTSYWYRTSFTVPTSYSGRTIWLNFDGINYGAEIWVNGKRVGTMMGAFSRGVFDISSLVKPGEQAVVAVRVDPQPHPGVPNEHTVINGTGHNGGISSIDGPTFLCTIGWDWIPGIRDRDTGIWQKVFLSATGPVLIKEPLISSDIPLPRLDSAELKIRVTLKNESDQPQKGILRGQIGERSIANATMNWIASHFPKLGISSPDYVAFKESVELPPHGYKVICLDPSTKPELQIKNPRLWWPNGYGPQNLYPVHLSFGEGGRISDVSNFSIGIRKITYTVPGTDNLTVSVNGVRVICKGGDWGLDEALKRIPRERLEAQIRMHQQANYTMIRNWVGQSTCEDLYELCDKYGIMLWDEFFQPNPGDGPNPTDLDTYLANVREKIVRFRNHPSIAIWCGRNEGRPPENINNALQKLMNELEPTRLYQPSSTDGHGVKSSGPYHWRNPRSFYIVDAPFKTEIGSVSVPTLEAVQAMMPQKDWETINDDWGEHDLGKGAQRGDTYPGELNRRYGKALNLADFVRKAQLGNYEAFRAMYEGRFAKLFQPVSGIITWMSNPAQPSFVWQLYSWDLEPNASLFATRKACEHIHIMLNESTGHLQVINNNGTPLTGVTASVTVYNLNGTVVSQRDQKVEVPVSAVSDLGAVELPATISKVYFVKLQLHDAASQLISDNFYWRGSSGREDELENLEALPVVKLQTTVRRHDADGKSFLDVTLHNPSGNLALMTHLQLRRKGSGERILPVYYSDNYLSLVPQETKMVTIEASSSDLLGDKPLIVLDGWNVDVGPTSSGDCDVEPNKNAQVSSWPVTGIPIKWFDGPLGQIGIHCGGEAIKGFSTDAGYDLGDKVRVKSKEPVDISATPSVPASLYDSGRTGEVTYKLPMNPGNYAVRLYFVENDFGGEGDSAQVSDATGKRRFCVDINGKSVLDDFDISVAAGGRNKAVSREFEGIVPDKDGNISIHFRPGVAGRPVVNGIEIVPTTKGA